MFEHPDVIVIGAGHAGCEAAHACAVMKMNTLLLTMSVDNIAQMSCNPAIGGVAKGHLVKEIDALGGIMGMLADETGIQFRTLNTSKGPAVRATRCQSDMAAYKAVMKRWLENTPLLKIAQREVTELIQNGDRVQGVVTDLDEKIFCKTVIITTGTFLNGRIHIGEKTFSSGRAGEFSSVKLSDALQANGLKIGRLKTGTTPRLDKRTIDFSILEEQRGDEPVPKFSFWNSCVKLSQVSCHITHTNKTGHSIIADNLNRSAMYGGGISSAGPRYCPSIEDKIVKFPDKDRHQIFLEPTGLDSVEIYPNGMSTSMPVDVQLSFMRSIRGLGNVEIIRPGYAIEYDFCFPNQLKLTMETKNIENLFLAGQINGTTGYEEAAAQGLIAGINAAQKIKGKPAFVLKRNESYIGVLIDDLISKSTDEPYRMFTSRAEYRLFLREDNADRRLCKKGYEIGLLSEDRYVAFRKKQERLERLTDYLKTTKYKPTGDDTERFKKMGLPVSVDTGSLATLLKKPGYSLSVLDPVLPSDFRASLSVWTRGEKSSVEADIRYEGYLKRQDSQVKNYLRIEAVHIPDAICYDTVNGLSNEVKEKLAMHRPQTLGQANRISGITPAAIHLLQIYIRNRQRAKKRPA